MNASLSLFRARHYPEKQPQQKPMLIQKELWTRLHDNSDYFELKPKWEEGTLSLFVKHGGGFPHPHEVSLLDTSTTEERRYYLIFKDTIKYDRLEGLRPTRFNVDLSDWVKESTEFVVVKSTDAHNAFVIGKVTF